MMNYSGEFGMEKNEIDKFIEDLGISFGLLSLWKFYRENELNKSFSNLFESFKQIILDTEIFRIQRLFKDKNIFKKKLRLMI